MKVDFSKKHVAMYICAFLVAQVITAFEAASFSQTLLPTNDEKTIYLVAGECGPGKTKNLSQQSLGSNRKQDTYMHELPQMRF